MRHAIAALAAVALATVGAWPDRVAGQSFERAGVEFHAMRRIGLPRDEDYAIVVTQFFHHDEIAPDGSNVVVSTPNEKLVPARVLQVGPGDYCRLAFQTAPRQSAYNVLYGGPAPDADALPAWNAKHGLLLETREYRECDLNRLDSVRQAFESSTRIGADYVANVLHSHNPFSLKPGPFLSRYSGYLRIDKAGTYGFLTSSQDCSFLLIDGKLVVEAPGRHRPQRRAKPESRKDVRLTAGEHKFEYYHAASGPQAMMVAAWEVAPAAAKPKPKAIPTRAFGTAAVGRVRAGPVSTQDMKLAPDFLLRLEGDVPLPDNDLALIGVRFVNASSPALTTKAKLTWDFGDGQTGEGASPTHVYLRPGLYAVKLSVTRVTRTLEMTNRVYIDRPKVLKAEQFHKLDDYLPILQAYDPRKLDLVSLRQLVLAYQFKVDHVLAPPQPKEAEAAPDDEPAEDDSEAKPDPAKARREAEKARREKEARRAEALEYVKAAVAAGKLPFLGDPPADEEAPADEDVIRLARLVGPMARDELGDPLLAARIWHGASRRIADNRLKGECETQAADVAISDLLKIDVGKELLEAATAHLQGVATGPVAARLKRVWGDYYAATGDGENARKAYSEAESVLAGTRTHVERTAWQGAHSRSTDQFLKSGELDRAAEELRAWQDEFPADKIDGYLNLMLARYWAGREAYAQAVAQAEAQLAVNPDSPHVDQLLVVASDCEVERGRVDRALAFLNQLLKDYPGSPLVPAVRENVAKLEAGEAKAPKTPAAKAPAASE